MTRISSPGPRPSDAAGRVANVGSLAVVAAMFVLVLVISARPLSDPDTWWHLVMGEKFVHGGSLTDPGPMSAFGTEDWRPRDWLTQILMARAYDWFGLPGVAWLYGAGLVVFVIVLFRTCREFASAGPAMLATSVGFVAALTSLTARPQLVSFVLVLVTLRAVRRQIVQGGFRWWLVPLTGLWACMHGFWFVGVAIQSLVLPVLWLEQRIDRTAVVRAVALPLLSIGAVGVTPNGFYLLRHPFGETVLQVTAYIQEYRPPSVQSPFYVTTLAMLAAVVLTWALRRERPGWYDLALWVLAAVAAVQMARTVTLGAILVTPVFAGVLDGWLLRLDWRVPPWLEASAIYGLGAVCALLMVVIVPKTSAVPGPAQPTALDADLDRLPDGTVIFNKLGDGGYLRWRHPALNCVIDGLADQYSVSWQLAIFKAGRLEPGWERTVVRTGATYALLQDSAPLATALELRGWTLVREGGDRLLLRAPPP